MNKSSKNNTFIYFNDLLKTMATKKRQLFFATLFSIVFVLASISFASAAMTFVAPTAGGTVNGTFTFEVTIATSDVTNALFGNWSTTDDPFFNNTKNITEEQVSWNITMDTSVLTDAEDTTLTVNISNATASITSSILINVDNTDPVCSFTKDRDNVKFQDGLGLITTQGSTDTTDLTYSWILSRGDGTTSTTKTEASPTFLGADFDQIDEFVLALTVTDEASKSNICTNQTIGVAGSNGVTIPGIATASIIKDNKAMFFIGIVVVLLSIITIVSLIVVNKNKN